MFDRLEIFRMAQALAVHAAARQTIAAGNVANADTPGYRAHDAAPFSQTYDSMTEAMRTTRPELMGGPGVRSTTRLIDVGGEASPNGNTVSLESEMVRATEIRGQHDRALAIYRSGLHILRTTIGRG